MPENDKTNQTNTDISLPKEEWEKKNKTASFNICSDNFSNPTERHANDKMFFRSRCVFSWASVCGMLVILVTLWIIAGRRRAGG